MKTSRFLHKQVKKSEKIKILFFTLKHLKTLQILNSPQKGRKSRKYKFFFLCFKMFQNAGNVEFCIIMLFSSCHLMKKKFWGCRLLCAENMTYNALEHFGLKNKVLKFIDVFHFFMKNSRLPVLWNILEWKRNFEFFRVLRSSLSENNFCHGKAYLKIREKQWEYDDPSNSYPANIAANTERISWFWNLDPD